MARRTKHDIEFLQRMNATSVSAKEFMKFIEESQNRRHLGDAFVVQASTAAEIAKNDHSKAAALVFRAEALVSSPVKRTVR